MEVKCTGSILDEDTSRVAKLIAAYIDAEMLRRIRMEVQNGTNLPKNA